MSNGVDPGSAQTCIWMSAGLLTYKLCDRDFDCETCPLDAALRGVPQTLNAQHEATAGLERQTEISFPEDRLYSAGHTWVQQMNGPNERHRFGLDSLAASLIICPRQIRWNGAPRVVQRGETICAIEFDGGSLRLGAPVVAHLSGRNQVLDDDPADVLSAPYGGGWIVDLDHIEESELDRLLSAEAAREQARLDLRRFRRRIALHLLADAGSVGPTLADGGELLADPWRILGGVRYLELLRELVH